MGFAEVELTDTEEAQIRWRLLIDNGWL